MNSTCEPAQQFVTVDRGLPFVLFALTAGVLLRTLLKWVPRHAQPPYPVLVLLLSLVAASIRGSLGPVGESIKFWQESHPHVILFVLIPPLVYDDASALPFHTFKGVFAQALVLSSVAAVISVCVLAPIIHSLISADGWLWPTSFLLASIVSATDPIAVVAVLHTLGAPHAFRALIAGQALLNDGMVFVLFLIFRDMMLGSDPTFLGHVGMLVRLLVGGVGWGAVAALALGAWFLIVFDDSAVQHTLVLVAGFAAFFLGESWLHVSGVLATVVVGLYMSARGRFSMGPRVARENHAILAEVRTRWPRPAVPTTRTSLRPRARPLTLAPSAAAHTRCRRQVSFAASTVLFSLAGVVTYDRIRGAPDLDFSAQLLNNLLIFLATNAARLAAIALLFPLLRRLGYGLSWREALVMAYTGLRGAIGIALALLIEEDVAVPRAVRSMLAFHVAGA